MPRTSLTPTGRMTRPPSPSVRNSRLLQAKVQSDLRLMQDQWWQDKAAEVQYYANTHNSKQSFSSLKAVIGPSASSCSPLLASDGSTLIKDQEGLSKRWHEHFSNLPNRPSSVDKGALNQIPQQPIQESLAEPRTMDEIKKAIHKTTSGRASGKDGIPAEIYKAACPNALEAFHDVLLGIWEEEKMPDDFRETLMSPSTRTREASQTVGTTEVSVSFLWQERYLPELFSTDSSLSQSRTSQRRSLASGPEEVLYT